jgi:hypothetical protein
VELPGIRIVYGAFYTWNIVRGTIIASTGVNMHTHISHSHGLAIRPNDVDVASIHRQYLRINLGRLREFDSERGAAACRHRHLLCHQLRGRGRPLARLENRVLVDPGRAGFARADCGPSLVRDLVGDGLVTTILNRDGVRAVEVSCVVEVEVCRAEVGLEGEDLQGVDEASSLLRDGSAAVESLVSKRKKTTPRGERGQNANSPYDCA